MIAKLLGLAEGALLAPFIAGISALRRARMFHPRGVTYSAQISALVDVDRGALGQIARRLQGPALVRLSSALWKQREWRDVLGIALRLSDRAPTSALAAETDQDLLFATIRLPLTLALAPLTTRQHDFLANHYFAVSPFRIDGIGRVKWRLRPTVAGPRRGHTRDQRLESATRLGIAQFVIEVSRGWLGRWTPVAELRLEAPLEIDQEALAFSPFRAGRGIRPIGLVQHLRRATYAASQRARPRSA